MFPIIVITQLLSICNATAREPSWRLWSHHFWRSPKVNDSLPHCLATSSSFLCILPMPVMFFPYNSTFPILFMLQDPMLTLFQNFLDHLLSSTGSHLSLPLHSLESSLNCSSHTCSIIHFSMSSYSYFFFFWDSWKQNHVFHRAL